MNAPIGEKVRVHLNLQRGDFSITQGGRVVLSADDVTLRDVRFIVSEATRQRTIKHNRRRVHAWAEGTLVAVNTQPDVVGAIRVTYNPFRAPTFTMLDNPIERAPLMHFTERAGWLPMPTCMEHSQAGRRRG